MKKSSLRLSRRKIMQKFWSASVALSLSILSGPALARAQVTEQHQPKIAIIGAGASGLTTAYLLQKNGYTDVTLFEKEDSVGGVAHTVQYQGKFYDMSTMFVPGGNIAGNGIEPLLKEMIAVSGQRLVPAVDFDTLHLPAMQLNPLNELSAHYAPEVLSQQLIKGLSLMTQFAYCLANQIDSVSCGISLPEQPNENIHAWGERNGVPAFTSLIVYTADALGAGPVSYITATAGLYAGFQWTPVEVVRILKHLGVTREDLPFGTPPNIVSLLSANEGEGTQRWWFFKKGYQTFWQALVKKANLNVKLSEPVLMLSENEDRTLRVETHKANYDFDRVIVATAPRAAMHFLPEGAQKELLSDAISKAPPNDVFLARITGYESTGFPEQAAWWPTGFGLGAFDLIDPSRGGSAVKSFFWQKRHARDVVFVGTYTLSPAITPDDAFTTVKDYAWGALGFNVTEKIAHKRFLFPASPSDRAAWAVGWQNLQGANGLFFVGEAFTGSGVPAITSGLNRLIPTYFPEQ